MRKFNVLNLMAVGLEFLFGVIPATGISLIGFWVLGAATTFSALGKLLVGLLFFSWVSGTIGLWLIFTKRIRYALRGEDPIKGSVWPLWVLCVAAGVLLLLGLLDGVPRDRQNIMEYLSYAVPVLGVLFVAISYIHLCKKTHVGH